MAILVSSSYLYMLLWEKGYVQINSGIESEGYSVNDSVFIGFNSAQQVLITYQYIKKAVRLPGVFLTRYQTLYLEKSSGSRKNWMCIKQRMFGTPISNTQAQEELASIHFKTSLSI